jgi:hypothetical protein
MVFTVTGTTKYYIAIGRRPRILKHLSVLKYLKKIYYVSVTVLASQGLRSALLIFTLGIVKRIFEVTRWRLICNAASGSCNQSERALQKAHDARLSFPFVWMPWKLTQDYNRQCLLVQTFCTNTVAANRTNWNSNMSRLQRLLLQARHKPSSLAKGYVPLYSSSPLASLDGFSRSHGDCLYVSSTYLVHTLMMEGTCVFYISMSH